MNGSLRPALRESIFPLLGDALIHLHSLHPRRYVRALALYLSLIVALLMLLVFTLFDC